MMCTASIRYRRAVGSVVILAAVAGMSGCIPTDNSLMRTALYVMALQQASHRAMMANHGPVLRDDCERTDDLYLACRYNALSAFLTPTVMRHPLIKQTGTPVTMTERKTLSAPAGRNEVVASIGAHTGGINSIAASAPAIAIRANGHP